MHNGTSESGSRNAVIRECFFDWIRRASPAVVIALSVSFSAAAHADEAPGQSLIATQQQKLTASGINEPTQFGASVALSGSTAHRLKAVDKHRLGLCLAPCPANTIARISPRGPHGACSVWSSRVCVDKVLAHENQTKEQR